MVVVGMLRKAKGVMSHSVAGDPFTSQLTPRYTRFKELQGVSGEERNEKGSCHHLVVHEVNSTYLCQVAILHVAHPVKGGRSMGQGTSRLQV